MSPLYSRRKLLKGSVVAVTAFLAGCSETDTPKTETSDPHLSNNTAEEAALAAETEFVESRLSEAGCLDTWDISAGSDAMTVERNVSEVIVSVERPYSYTDADGIEVSQTSDAKYIVTENGTQRINGTMEVPC